MGQTLIAGHALKQPLKPGVEMRYRVLDESAKHSYSHDQPHDAINFGAGPAGTNAPGMSQAQMHPV